MRTKTLFVGFRGKNNASATLVSALSSASFLLTNSFAGLIKDIEDLPSDYDEVWLFGVDKNLVDSIRIEQVAEKDGIQRYSKLAEEILVERLFSTGVKVAVSSTPTRYLCNEAYWHLLGKYVGNAVLIHIPTIKHFNEEWFSKMKLYFS
ncbi:MAG: hypothetical protein K5678_12105 [Acetatifactor sp.]|nr:hypothetical protein [Acetatifactor sp.]